MDAYSVKKLFSEQQILILSKVKFEKGIQGRDTEWTAEWKVDLRYDAW